MSARHGREQISTTDRATDDRLEKRRRAFIDSARTLFIEQGFDKTSLSDVVSRAGGSLATLYKLFGNKAGLLAEVVNERTRSGESLISRIGQEIPEPRAALLELGQTLRDEFFDEEGVAISRIVIAYSLQDPQFASEFHRGTLMRSQHALAALFETWRSHGMVLTSEPEALASLFLGLFVQELHSDAISHGAMAQFEFRDLEAKVDFFCRGAGLAC